MIKYGKPKLKLYTKKEPKSIKYQSCLLSKKRKAKLYAD